MNDDLLREAAAQLARAEAKHAPMRGHHEGYAVILEELDELWAEVKRQQIDPVALRKEAMHVAVMGLRFVKDVCHAEPAGELAQPDDGSGGLMIGDLGRGEWRFYSGKPTTLRARILPDGSVEAGEPAPARHRCSGCGLHWGDPSNYRFETGAELCGDCWRKAQPVLHAPAPAQRPAEAEIFEVAERVAGGQADNADAATLLASLTDARRQLAEARVKYDVLLRLKSHSPLCSGCRSKYKSDRCVACERDDLERRLTRAQQQIGALREFTEGVMIVFRNYYGLAITRDSVDAKLAEWLKLKAALAAGGPEPQEPS